MANKVLAIDLGASSGRGMIGTVNDGKLEIKEIHRFSNGAEMIDGKLCWNIQMLIKEIKVAIEKAGDISAIGFDTWGVDYGVIDEKGKLVGNPLSYRDYRTEGMVEKAEKTMPLSELYSITGNQIMQINTLFQLIAEDKDLKNKKILFMPDLLGYLLTGNMVMEKTIASTSQMLDMKNKVFSKDVLKSFNIDENILSDISETGKKLGKYKGIDVITVAGHDTQCAISAVPSLEEEYAYISSGTWSLFGVEIDEPILSKESFEMGLSNEISSENRYNYLKNVTGLWIIQECKKAWGKYSYDEIDGMALEAGKSKCFIDGDDECFSKPCDMPLAVQQYCERTKQYVPQTVGEIARCVYESLANKYKLSLEQIEKITGKKFQKLFIVGGGSKVLILNQLTANAIGRPVVAGVSEATAIGNIMLQLRTLGDVKDRKQAKDIIISSEKLKYYEPQEN